MKMDLHTNRSLREVPRQDGGLDGSLPAVMPTPLECRLGYVFRDRETLRRVLEYPSWRHGALPGGIATLGSAVLEVACSELFFRARPAAEEGVLSRLRTSVLRTEALNQVAREVGLADAVVPPAGTSLTGTVSLLPATLKALLGAIVHDGSMEDALEAGRKILVPLVLQAQPYPNYKSDLIAYCVTSGRPRPEYVPQHEGPDHDRIFHVTVVIDDAVIATATERTVIEAEKSGAKAALEELRAIDAGARALSTRPSRAGDQSHG